MRNEVITANTSVYKRATAPVYLKNEWGFGKIIGVIEAGNSVRIIKTQEMVGAYYDRYYRALVTENKKMLKK